MVNENTDAAAEEPVVDRYHMVYFIAVLFGTAMLFPYNAFIATPPYVKKYYTFASGNANYTTTMPHVWHNIENYLMVCSLVPNFFGQIALMTPLGRKLPLFPRFAVSLLVMIVFTLAVIIIPLMEVSEEGALATLLVSTTVTNLGAAIFQASMFSFAAFFPFVITQGVMLGIGVSGSLASILAVIIKASMGNTFPEENEQAQIYFGIAVAMLVVSFLCLFALRQNAYAKHHISEWRDEPGLLETEEGVPDTAASPLVKKSAMADANAVTVLKKVWPMILSVFWVFTVSLVVFPSFGVKFHPDNDWFAVLIILMFNVGDFSGRFLCRFSCLLIKNRYVVQGLSAARTLLVILFFLCIRPRVIDSIPFEYILMYVTGLTNGYVGSHCMMLAPSTPGLETDADRGLTGNSMSVGLLAGAAAGSLLSLAIVPQL